MAEPGKEHQCRPLFSSAAELINLTFEVAGAEVDRLPERIINVLKSKEVQEAIKKSLEEQAKKLLEAQKTPGQKPPDPKQAETVLKDTGKAVLDATSKELQSQIENSPAVKRLKAEAEKVWKDFECSPVGVWVNENKTLVYVVGGVLALAGAGAMYLMKSGDSVAAFAQGKGKTFKLGKIEITGKLTKFVPSKQEIGASVAVTGKWERLKIDLTIAGTAVGDQGTLSTDGKIMVPLYSGLSFVTLGKYTLGGPPGQRNEPMVPPAVGQWWRPYQYSIAAGLNYEKDGLSLNLLGVVENDKPSAKFQGGYTGRVGDFQLRSSLGMGVGSGAFTGQGSLGVSTNRWGVPMELNATGNVTPQGAYNVQGTFVIRFGATK